MTPILAERREKCQPREFKYAEFICYNYKFTYMNIRTKGQKEAEMRRWGEEEKQKEKLKNKS